MKAVLKRARVPPIHSRFHVTDNGSVWHDADRKTGPFYLADAARSLGTRSRGPGKWRPAL